MNNNLLAWLLATGLDEQRAQIYLAALSRGEATAYELAVDLKLGRTAIYDNLRVLAERGYITSILQGKRKIFIPTHPKELYKKVEHQKEQLKDLLPDFLAIYAAKNKKPFVQIHSGPFSAREVYEDILATTKKEYVYFSPPQLTLQTVDPKWMESWVKRRVSKGLKCRSLRIKSKSIDIPAVFVQEQEYLRQIKYLPEYVDLQSSIYVYENNIGVISTSKENAAFIIFSPDLAFSLKQLFEFLWGISSKSIE
ncbi:MAG: helix-turn-helix domain-containing protein [Patescibacteria group bacterium]